MSLQVDTGDLTNIPDFYLSVGLYPSKIRWRALDILTAAMATCIDNADAVLAQLVSWPSVELRLFLKQLAAVKLGPK